ncbi:MAG: Hsp20/alpha crystallin family protein [Spirochaetaceae bacterium]|jgi:HSP20 family molecular chaperone IbpA|nr:Hsp20/alpha crystallin family protein [Spirochaetaceae bacterium]
MKTVSLYRPFNVERPVFDVEKFVDSFFGENGASFFNKASWKPAVDVIETKDSYIVEAELPGFEEKDVEVNVDNNTLTIESKLDKETGKKDNEKAFVIRERCVTHFSRSFKLPDNADTSAVEARFKNGLLELEIKKSAEAKKRIIQIGK